MGASIPIAGQFQCSKFKHIFASPGRPSVKYQAAIGRLDAGSNCDLDKSPCQAGMWG